MRLDEFGVEDFLLEWFGDLGATLMARIEANSNETRTLATLRDTLLPKLLSGELSLPAAMLAAQAGVASLESRQEAVA